MTRRDRNELVLIQGLREKRRPTCIGIQLYHLLARSNKYVAKLDRTYDTEFRPKWPKTQVRPDLHLSCHEESIFKVLQTCSIVDEK